jgi:hypothetical protein
MRLKALVIGVDFSGAPATLADLSTHTPDGRPLDVRALQAHYAARREPLAAALISDGNRRAMRHG